MAALIKDPVFLLAYLAGIVGLVFQVSRVPRLQGLFDRLPALVWTYFIPMLSTSAGIIPDEAADEVIGHLQRDRAGVHEVAQVLELHERLDECLLELRSERVDRVGRRRIGELEDLAHGAREEIRRLGRLHERERGLLTALLHEREELVRGEAEADDDGGRGDDPEDDLQLDRHRFPPPRGSVE